MRTDFQWAGVNGLTSLFAPAHFIYRHHFRSYPPAVPSTTSTRKSVVLEVDVEVLDVTDDEARALLLSIDPLAALAETQAQIHRRLLERTPTSSEELHAVWRAAAEASLAAAAAPEPSPLEGVPAQFLIVITCRDEGHQIELLQRFAAEGLEGKALVS